MKPNHSPRTVEHHQSKCSAYGCPMPGAITHSTTGTSEWFCWFHFGKDSSQWQAITVELKRLGWLVETIQTLRGFYGTPGWPEIYKTALHTIRMNQRNDLEIRKGEKVKEWFGRLDKVLSEVVHAVSSSTPVRVELPKSDTWGKVQFEAPKDA